MIDPLYLAKSEEYLNNSPFKTSVITLIPIVKIYNNNISTKNKLIIAKLKTNKLH